MKRFLQTLTISVLAVLCVNATSLNVLTEDFENGLPEDWTQEYVQLPVTQSGNQSLYSWAVEEGDSLVYPTGCISGTHRLKAANTTNQEMRFVTLFVSPQLNLTGVFRPQMSFYHAEPMRTSFCDTLRLYYRTSASEVWRPLTSTAYTRNNRWVQETVSLISPNATYQIAFEITEAMGRGVVIDDVVIGAMPTCEDVENIVCSNIHAYDVTLSWDAFGAYNEFQVMIADEELDLTNIDEKHVVQLIDENVYDPSLVVTGLIPETNYYVYVRSDCEETEGWTNWVSTSFRTLKVAYLPYTENFNSTIAITGSSAYGVPDGWTVGNNLDVTVPMAIRNVGATAAAPYSIDSTAYLGFVGALSTTPEAIPAGSYAYAVTPEIVAKSLQGLEVRFWLTAADFVTAGINSYGGELIVGTITDPVNIRTFTPLDTVKIGGTYLFRHVSVSLADYAGTDKFIALVSRSSMANAMFVDNFTMTMPEVFVPTDIELDGVTSTGFTVKPNLHGASVWDLVVATDYARDGNVDESSVLLSESNISAASYTVNLATLAGQTVQVYVRSHNGASVSEWSFAKTIRVPATMPVLTDSTSFTLSFEEGNTLVLSTLDEESRLASTYRGVEQVYYPLSAVSSDVVTYPLCVSTAPNYRGAHLQICGADSWFVLPEVSNALNTMKMVFRYASLSNLRGALAVGVMSDPYDLTTFEQITSFTAEGTDYVRCLVSFDEYAGAGKYIAFRTLNAGSGTALSTNLIDEVIVSLLGDCREASNVTVSAHADYANVSWNGGGMDAWIVGLSAQKNMLNASYRTVTTPQVSFTDLTQETQYYCTIQTICGEDTLDLDDVRYAFTTPRGLPFEEPFASAVAPSGWTRSLTRASSVFSGTAMTLSTSSYSGWQFSSSSTYVHSPLSGYVAYMTMSSSSNYGWLISPELYVDADPDKPLELVFKLGMSSYNSSSYTTGECAQNDKFMVVVSEDGGNTWLRTNATVWNNDGTGDYVLNDLIWDGGEEVKIDFTPYIGKRIKFAFYAESTTSTYYNYICVDDIVLRVGDERCGGLSRLTAYAQSLQSAIATWQIAGTDPWPAVVQLSTSKNFASLMHNDTIDGTTRSYTDLESNTTYYLRARQLCANDAEWKSVTFHTPCAAVTPEDFGVETFDDTEALNCWAVGFTQELSAGTLPQIVTDANFGSVLQIAKSSVDTTASDGAYAILPELDLDDAVKDISHYQIIFKAGTNSSSSTNVARIKVGIITDLSDISYTWREQAEVQLQYAADSTELKTYAVSFENYRGDLDGVMGHYIMFLSEAGTDSTNYVLIDEVLVTDAEGCHMVLDLAADSLTIDGGRLYWTGNGTSYEVGVSAERVKPDTCSNWLFHQTVSGTSCKVTGLEATTTYYAYIRAICDDETYGRWSSATYFKTRKGIPYIETFDGISSQIFEEDILQASGVHFTSDSVTINPAAKSATSYSDGWILTDMTESDWSGISGMGGKAVRADMYSTYAFWMVLPTLDMSGITDESVLFSAKVAACQYSSKSSSPSTLTDDRLGVLVSLDGGTTWLKQNATFWSKDSVGDHAFDFGVTAKRIELDLTDYIGRSITLAILAEKRTSNGDNWILVDSLSVVKAGSECVGVRHATLTLNGADEAIARWSIFGTPKEVVYEWSDEADFVNVIETDTTANDSLVFTDLESGHTYYIRLHQLDCPGGSVTLQVSTPSAIPFVEAFDAKTLPATWTILSGDADAAISGTSLPEELESEKAWGVCTKNYGLPANHIEGRFSNSATYYNKVWLVSPDVLIPEGSEDVKLMFDLAFTAVNKTTAPPDSTDSYEFRVMVSTDQGQSWSENEWVFRNNDEAFMKLNDVPTDGTRVYLPMDAFVGEQIRFAFYRASTIKNGGQLHIANVQMREMSEACDAPDSLKISNTTFNSADLTWQGDESKSFIIEYSLQADFTNAKRDTVYGVLTHTLSDLRVGSTYFVHVQQVCGSKSISDFGETVSFRTSIGLPYTNALSSSEGLQKFRSPIADGLSGVRSTYSSSLLGWKNTSGTEVLSAAHALCTSSSTYAYWYVFPEIDLTQVDATAVLLEIDLALTQSEAENASPVGTEYAEQNKFYVAVSVDDNETYLAANAWEFSSAGTAAYSYAGIPAGAGATYRMDFSRFVGQKIRIALVNMSPVSSCIHAARLSLTEAASVCFGVSNVKVEDVDTTAVVNIVPLDGASLWELAYGLQGTALDDMRHQETGTLTGTILHELQLNSTYDVYARSICSEDDMSPWSGPFSFATPLGLTYEEPFDGSLSDWTRYTGDPTTIAAGDTLVPVSTGWSVQSNSAYSLGAPHIYCQQSTSAYNWLVSPVINLKPQDGSKSIWLSMDAALTSTNTGTVAPASAAIAAHTFRVVVSEDGGATWPVENTILFGSDTASVDYIYTSIPGGAGKALHLDLSRYAGKVIRIALVQGKAASGQSVIHIKNLELAEYVVPCWNVSSFTAVGDGSTARVSIVDENSTAVAWQYAVGQTGFVPSSSAAVTVDTTEFVISNLPMSSTLDIYVRSLCGESDTSAWVGPKSVTTPIGIPYYESFNYSSSSLPSSWAASSSSNWYIGRSSYVWGQSHAYINTYSTYTGRLISPTINLMDVSNSVQLSFDLALTAYGSSAAPSNALQQTLEVRVSTDGGQSYESVAIWGQDATADYMYADIPNTGERYYVDLSDFAGESVRIGFFTASSGGDNDIHIKDLRVDTVAGAVVNCPTIRRATLTDSTFHEATLQLRGSGIDRALAFEYVCLPENSIFTTRNAVVTNSALISLSGLSSSSAYELFVRAQCSDSTWANWTGPFLFHTVECSEVTGLSGISVSMDEVVATVVTQNADAALGYQAFFGASGEPIQRDRIETFNSSTLHFVTSLETNTTYDIYVRKICQVGDTSSWTGPFHVQSPIGVPYYEQLTGSSLPESWTAGISSYPWKMGKGSYVWGVDHAAVNVWSTYSTELLMPDISMSNVEGSTLELSFELALTHYNSSDAPASYDNQSFSVKVSTDGGTNYVPVAVWASTGTRDYEYSQIPAEGDKYTIDMSAFIGSPSVRIGFFTESTAATSGVSNDNDIHLRYVALDTITDNGCGRINSLVAHEVTLNSAIIEFSYPEGQAQGSAVMEVAEDVEFGQIIVSERVDGEPLLMLQNLSASTTYYVRAKNICDANRESAWSNVINFTTARGVRYREDFNTSMTFKDWTQSTTLTSTVFADGILPIASSGNWSRGTGHTDIFPTAHAIMNIYVSSYSSSPRTGWLVSPLVDLSPNAGQGLLLAFDLALCKYSGGGAPAASNSQNFYVVVSEDGGQTWSSNNMTSWVSSGTGDYDYSTLGIVPQRFYLDMSRYGGKQVKIAFCSEQLTSDADNYIMIDNIDLNAVLTLNYNDTICEFEDYDAHGFNYSAGDLQIGQNEYTIIAQNFDTLTHLNIYVKPMPHTEVADTICEGEEYNGHGFEHLQATVSGTYNRYAERPGECDSLLTLHLTVLPKIHVEKFDTLCDGSSITIKGKTYYNDAIVVDTTSSAITGCDSITTYYLTFSGDAVMHEEVWAIICAGQRYRDGLFNERETGTYYGTTASAAGCDSIVTLHLMVAPADGMIYDTVRVDRLPYTFFGKEYIPEGAEAGEYTFQLESATEDCNPVLNVHVDPISGIHNIEVGQLSLAPNPVLVGEQLTIVSELPQTGAFRAVIYNSIGQEVYTVSEYTRTLPALWASGIYMLRIESGKQLYEGKVMVK